MKEARFKELAQRLANRTDELRGSRRPSTLRVVRPTESDRTMCDVTRSSHIRMINHYRRWYGLQLLVDQACVGYGGVDQLPDEAILALHRDIDRARECIKDGVSWEDAGLLRAVG